MGALLLQSGFLAAGNTANYEVVPFCHGILMWRKRNRSC